MPAATRVGFRGRGNAADTRRADPAGMTWSRFAAGAAEVVTSETLWCGESRALHRPVGPAHAVPAPASSGTTAALCGERVTVVRGLDWQMVWGVPRCPSCRQLAGG
jgi:hypothetical protein